MINKESLLVGSDPEFFVEKNGKIKSSIGIIPGTKNDTVTIEQFEILKDNVLVEGNIPPARSRDEFIATMENLKEVIFKYFKVKAISKNSHNFDQSELQDEEAREFGCSSYLNAWEACSVKAANLAEYNTRTAGFHIHIGYDMITSDIEKSRLDSLIAKAFDYFCVIPSRNHMPDAFRDENYGALGSYREKPYGLEVRGLGGYFSNSQYLGWVYDRVIDTIDYCSIIENLEKLELITTPNFTLGEYEQLGINFNNVTIK